MNTDMLPQPPPSSVADIEPGRIKVFGIIHIIFGALGLLGALSTVVMLLLVNPVLLWFEDLIKQEVPPEGAADPAVVALIDYIGSMRTLMSDLSVLYWVSGVTGLVVAVLILRAGMRLVRKRRDAVACSNGYTYASIAKWVLYLGLYLVTAPAAMRRYYEAMEDMMAAGGAAPPGMMQLQEAIGTVSSVLTAVLAMVYPVLAYVMLNKPMVKEFLARNGT